MRKQRKARRASKGEFYDVSADATVEIKEPLKKRELTVTYTCGNPPSPPCLPPPKPAGSSNVKKKKVYVVHDSNQKELTLLVEVTFATNN